MYADLFLEGSLTADEQYKFLSRMKSSTEKLQWIMDSLIKMSRLEVGSIQLAPAHADINYSPEISKRQRKPRMYIRGFLCRLVCLAKNVKD